MDAVTGTYVDGREYRSALEKRGFKYDPMTKTLFISYPFVPKEFADQGAGVVLYSPGVSQVSKINSVDFYKRGSGFKKTDRPDQKFREYVERLLDEGVRLARPKVFIA